MSFSVKAMQHDTEVLRVNKRIEQNPGSICHPGYSSCESKESCVETRQS